MSMFDRVFAPLVPEGWTLHECPSPDFPDVGKEDYGHGEAITAIGRSPQGTWWAWAGSEYASPITYCPLCGQRLGENA